MLATCCDAGQVSVRSAHGQPILVGAAQADRPNSFGRLQSVVLDHSIRNIFIDISDTYAYLLRFCLIELRSSARLNASKLATGVGFGVPGLRTLRPHDSDSIFPNIVAVRTARSTGWFKLGQQECEDSKLLRFSFRSGVHAVGFLPSIGQPLFHVVLRSSSSWIQAQTSEPQP